jgi:Ca-activated chloride channel family protein
MRKVCTSTNGSNDYCLMSSDGGRTIIFLAALVCVFFCFPAASQELGAAATQTIRVSVELVNVSVIVTDSRDKFVQGLRREDFHVFDNGVEQPITQFATVDEPGQILLLIEAGPAVYFLQDAHIFAADAMLNGLSPSDRVAIARYDISPTPILAFTSDKSAAQAALSAIRFNLGFGQLNLSSSLLTVLDWLTKTPGKKTILLLSTGVDTSTAQAIQSLQLRLQTGDVRILCVSVSGPMRNGKKGSARQLQQNEQVFAQADSMLRAIADATGGRAYFPENEKAIQEIYRQVAELVRNEYSLAFAPPVADGNLHSINVSVNLPAQSPDQKLPDYRVDHRKSYQAPKP